MAEPSSSKPSPITRFDGAVASVNAVVASTLLVLLTLDVLWGVTSRFFLDGQARWSEEAARLLLVWVSLLGGAVAYSSGAHLGLDLLVERMDPAVGRMCRRCAAGVVYLFAVGVMVVGGAWLYAERLGFGQTMPALGISRAWQYLAVPISGSLIAISAVREVFEPRGVEHGAIP
ncbi:MAG: transporter [Phycisphaerae bacterium]|nr:transporter [Phycisphaerae bacterium]